LFKAAIFDVDGTLIDSNDLHAQAWQQAFRKFGYELPLDRLHHQVGKGGDHYVPHFLTPEDNARFGKELDKYKTELFKREYASRIKAFPKVSELFQRIDDEGLKIAFATSSKGDELEKYKKLLGVDELVSEETSKDDARHSKPSPDIFAAALEKLRLSASEAIAIGDTPYDAQACGKLGLAIIGMLCGGFSENELREAGCCAIFRDPADLLEHFDESPLAVRKAA
jgi:HAD superfamily hydrolase (TIGR01509 family)